MTDAPEPYVDEFGYEWSGGKVAYFGVGLKLECPNGTYVSIVTGVGSQSLDYQVLANPHPPLPWPPNLQRVEYGERCHCQECCGRLVGDNVAAITAEADAIQATMKVNLDTYTLRYLESVRDAVVREAQLSGCGIFHDPDTVTDTYLAGPRRVSVQYAPSFDEVEAVTVRYVVAEPDVKPESYPNTLAGALAAVRGAQG